MSIHDDLKDAGFTDEQVILISKTYCDIRRKNLSLYDFGQEARNFFSQGIRQGKTGYEFFNKGFSIFDK